MTDTETIEEANYRIATQAIDAQGTAYAQAIEATTDAQIRSAILGVLTAEGVRWLPGYTLDARTADALGWPPASASVTLRHTRTATYGSPPPYVRGDPYTKTVHVDETITRRGQRKIRRALKALRSTGEVTTQGRGSAVSYGTADTEARQRTEAAELLAGQDLDDGAFDAVDPPAHHRLTRRTFDHEARVTVPLADYLRFRELEAFAARHEFTP